MDPRGAYAGCAADVVSAAEAGASLGTHTMKQSASLRNSGGLFLSG